MRIRTAALAVLVAAVPASCGTGGAPGTVHGTVIATGGPSEASPEPVPGTVTATNGGHRIARQKVAAGQEFSFRLAAGTYRLSVGDAGLGCADQTVTVAADTDQTVTLICPRK